MEVATTVEGDAGVHIPDPEDNMLPLTDLELEQEIVDATTTASILGGDAEATSDSLPGANLLNTSDEEKEISLGPGEDDSKMDMENYEDAITGSDGLLPDSNADDSMTMDDGEGQLEIAIEENSNSNASNSVDPDQPEFSITPVIKKEVLDEEIVSGTNATAASTSSITITNTSAENKSGKASQPISVQNGVEGSEANEENSSSSSSGENSKPLLSELLGGRKVSNSSTSNNIQQKPGLRTQSRSCSTSDGSAIAKELEEQIVKLNQLLGLKEQEWSAILRLKKHMEYALDQVKCTQKMGNVQDGVNGPLSTTELKFCISLIKSEKDALRVAERRIEESIESAETENESLQTIFPFRSSASSSSSVNALGGTDDGKSDSLSATAALQKLCERKRKAMDDLGPNRATRLRYNEPALPGGQGQSKSMGNGRRGNMLDVQTIIQSHRNLGVEKAPSRPKPAGPRNPPLTMTPERQYIKTIEDLIALAESDKLARETSILSVSVPSVPQIASTRTLQSTKPKNGKTSARQGAVTSNSLLISNPIPSGSGTLAKMLSPSTHSTGVGSASRSINDGSSNATQKFSNKLPTSDANLSLANLLASSKVETKVNMAKIKKERVREEEPSHVPSQQQADAVPICQGCNLSRAQFVCAGCANQWYCSRECQVAAWDEHSEICSG